MITQSQINLAFDDISFPKTKSKLAAALKTRFYLIEDRCSHLKFCKVSGFGKYELQDILDGKYPEYQTLKLKKRLLSENILKNECSECGISEWMGKPISLQLDHINGNKRDHSLINLRILCPNCHSQTDTYTGKNRGQYT